MLSPGQTVPVAIEKPAAGGRMIARVAGQVVLVADAIPGERVQARVERIGKGVVYAQTLSVDEPSADRRDPFPDPLCGGCLYSHIAYPRQLALKAQVIADAFRRIGRLELPAPLAVAGSPEEGYRMRARFHVRGHRLGFFRENSHEVCDARTTRQLLPETADTLDQLMAAMRSLGVESVREIELSENVDATERAVFLDSGLPIGEAALARMADTGGLTGLGSAWGAFGSPHVSDSLPLAGGHITLRRHVQAFFQGNRFLLRDLAAHVAALVPERGAVLDHGVAAFVAQGLGLDPHGGERAQGEDAAHHFEHRLVERFALFAGQQAGEFAGARFERIGKLVDQGRALFDGSRGPGWESALGRGDGAIDQGTIGLGAMREARSGRRIDDVEAGRTLDEFAIDQHPEIAFHHHSPRWAAGIALAIGVAIGKRCETVSAFVRRAYNFDKMVFGR